MIFENFISLVIDFSIATILVLVERLLLGLSMEKDVVCLSILLGGFMIFFFRVNILIPLAMKYKDKKNRSGH